MDCIYTRLRSNHTYSLANLTVFWLQYIRNPNRDCMLRPGGNGLCEWVLATLEAELFLSPVIKFSNIFIVPGQNLRFEVSSQFSQ